MKKHMVMALGLAWIAVFCLAGSSEAVKFRYENLGTLGGNQNYPGFGSKEAGINYAGQVVGYAFTAGGVKHAFVKSPGQAMVDLGLVIPGSGDSYARGISTSGIIGGYYSDAAGDHAVIWSQFMGMYQYASLGGTDSQVFGMNDAGTAAGIGRTSGALHAYVKPLGGTALDLGLPSGYTGSYATGINNADTVVGFLYDGNVHTPCIWSPSGGSYTAAAPLFSGADAKAFAINNLGQAVGYIKTSPTVFRAFLKSPGQGVQDLGALVGGTGWQSLAYDLNDSGWVVGRSGYYDGTRAFLWTPSGGMQDLNALVENLPAGVKLKEAHAINQRGEIAGYMDTDGSGFTNGIFKLTPMRSSLPVLLLLD
jgi:probable HAF family extracellular repeat protein